MIHPCRRHLIKKMSDRRRKGDVRQLRRRNLTVNCHRSVTLHDLDQWNHGTMECLVTSTGRRVLSDHIERPVREVTVFRMKMETNGEPKYKDIQNEVSENDIRS